VGLTNKNVWVPYEYLMNPHGSRTWAPPKRTVGPACTVPMDDPSIHERSTFMDFLLIWHNGVAKITPFRSCKDTLKSHVHDHELSFFPSVVHESGVSLNRVMYVYCILYICITYHLSKINWIHHLPLKYVMHVQPTLMCI
jgi:hypothetical protein